MRDEAAGRPAISTSPSASPTIRCSAGTGDDLHLVVPVAVHEAALGARVEIPVLDGTARLRVPPGTQTGQRLRLRGRGAPSPRDGRRGDLVAEIRVTLPRVLDERSKELLRQFAELHALDNVREMFGRLGE